jgi:hypothetical protein
MIGVLVDGSAGRVSSPRMAGPNKSKSIYEEADLVGVLPGLATVMGNARETCFKVAIAPSPNPTMLFVQKSYALQIRILLRVIDLKACPRCAAIVSLEDGAMVEVFKRDNRIVGIDELDLPAPLSSFEADVRALQLIDPTGAAISRMQDDRLAFVARSTSDAPDDPTFFGRGKVYIDEKGRMPLHVDERPRFSPIG